jgi:hypothetical protein
MNLENFFIFWKIDKIYETAFDVVAEDLGISYALLDILNENNSFAILMTDICIAIRAKSIINKWIMEID